MAGAQGLWGTSPKAAHQPEGNPKLNPKLDQSLKPKSPVKSSLEANPPRKPKLSFDWSRVFSSPAVAVKIPEVRRQDRVPIFGKDPKSPELITFLYPQRLRGRGVLARAELAPCRAQSRGSTFCSNSEASPKPPKPPCKGSVPLFFYSWSVLADPVPPANRHATVHLFLEV